MQRFKRYDFMRQCPKCGHQGGGNRHRYLDTSMTDDGIDSILTSCSRCSYRWYSDPLDKHPDSHDGPKADVEDTEYMPSVKPLPVSTRADRMDFSDGPDPGDTVRIHIGEVFQRMRNMMDNDPRDWSANRCDAVLYSIAQGWYVDHFKIIAGRHHFGDEATLLFQRCNHLVRYTIEQYEKEKEKSTHSD